MANNKISLTLNGDVPLKQFSEAMLHLNELIILLSKEVGENAQIEWQIEELEAGSATATVVGIYQDDYVVEKIVGAYETIGRALEKDEPIPYSQMIVKETKAITGIINEKISSVEFFTNNYSSSLITTHGVGIVKTKDKESLGSVRGLVETLSRRQSLRFIVYDDLFDKAVKCCFKETQVDMIRDIWDKRVVVTGSIIHDISSGRPILIKEIQDIKVLPVDTEGVFLKSRGKIPWETGDEPSEKTIRRLRDEERR